MHPAFMWRPRSLPFSSKRWGFTLRRMVLIGVLAGQARAQPTINLEAENGGLTPNLYVSTNSPGYSGAGYVTGFQTATDVVNWTFTGTAGLYELTITFRSPYGQKGFEGTING